MRVTFFVVALIATLAGACRSDLTSPAEITLQVNRMIDILDGRARVAIRARDIENIEALLHVECEGTNTTLVLLRGTPSEETCGMRFTLDGLNMDGAEARSANLTVAWDDQ